MAYIFYIHFCSRPESGLNQASLVVKWLKKKKVFQCRLIQEDPLEKEMVTHSNIVAWKIPWTVERGWLQSMELQRVSQDWVSMQEHIRYLLLCSQSVQSLEASQWAFDDSPQFLCMWEHLSGVGVAQGLLRLKPQEGSFRAGLAGFQTPCPSWWRGPRSLPSGPLHGFAFLRTPSETERERVEWSLGPFIPLL